MHYFLIILLFNLVFAKNVEVVVHKRQETLEIIFKPQDQANLPIISHFNNGVIAKFHYPVDNVFKSLNNIAYLKVSPDKKTIRVDLVKPYHVISTINSASCKKIILKEKVQVKAETILKNKKETKEDLIKAFDITIGNVLDSDDLILNIPFYKGKYAILQRDNILWVIVDNKDYCSEFTYPKRGLSHWESANSSSANVFRVNIEGFKATSSKLDSNLKQLQIRITKGISTLENNCLSVEETGKSYECTVNEACSIHEFFDDINQQNVKVLASDKPYFGLAKEQSSFYIKFLKSLQGIAFIDFCQGLKTILTGDKLIIEKPDAAIAAESILPWNFEGNFLEQKYELNTSIQNAESKKAKLGCIIKLAKLYFSQGFYQEALYATKQLRSLGEEYFNKDIKLQFFESVLFYLSGEKEKSMKLLNNLVNLHGRKNISSEIALWHCYMQREHQEAKNLFLISLTNFLKDYSNEIYWTIATDLFCSYLKDLDISSAKILLAKLGNDVPHDLFYLRQKYLCYTADFMVVLGKISEAEKILENVLSNEKSQFFLLPHFFYNKARYYAGKITLDELTQNLENCRLLNKDDIDELALLDFLANVYHQKADYIKELRILRYKKANLSNFNNPDFYRNINNTYHKLFIEQDFIKRSNAFDAVATFIEFQDLLPLGNEADKLVFVIIRKLVNLDLLDHSISLLEHQINYRLPQDESIAPYTNYLALLHLMNKSPEKAINALDASDKNSFSLSEYDKRLNIRAKALIDLQKYTEAMECVRNNFSEDGLMLKAEILFQSQDWQEYINLVNPYVISQLQSEAKISQELMQDILRLASSFLILDESASFSNLLKLIQTKDQELAQEISGLDIDKPSQLYMMLEKYTNNNKLERLMDRYMSSLFPS